MNYTTLSLALIGVALIVLLSGLALRRGRRELLHDFTMPWLASLVTLLVLTGIFDNLMIAAGLFSYSAAHRSGLQISLAPLEDFSYPLAVALLIPGLLLLLGRACGDRRRGGDERRRPVPLAPKPRPGAQKGAGHG